MSVMGSRPPSPFGKATLAVPAAAVAGVSSMVPARMPLTNTSSHDPGLISAGQ